MRGQLDALADNGAFGSCCNGAGGLSANQGFFVLCAASVCFFLQFICAWFLLPVFFPRFLTLSLAMKCDACSRVVSVIHSIIIVPALMGGIFGMRWGYHYEPLGDVSFLNVVFCISLGYFMYDTVVLMVFHPPRWQGFIIHHVVASIPYAVYIFSKACPYGLFILAGFMLVETTNLPFHLQATLKESDMGDTRLFWATFYITLFVWFFFRLVNPTLLVVILHTRVIPSLPPGSGACLVPGVTCAYVVCLFCYVVFAALCREALCRRPSRGESGALLNTPRGELRPVVP